MSYALVTGASRGLGLEFARQLASRGVHVFAAARRPEASEPLAALVAERPEHVLPVTLDVTSAEDHHQTRELVSARTDSLEYLINNAGINSRGLPPGHGNVSFGELEPAGMLRMMEVNAIAPVLLSQCFVELLARGAHPRVAHISSWFGSISETTRGFNYGYAASKACLNMLGRALAFDLEIRKIRSALFNPGWVRTDMGGPNAKVDPVDAVSGILKLLDELSPEDVGGFFDHDGTRHAW